MTSRTARHEESFSSSNVVRTLHPSRPLSPPQKNIEYNNNNLGRLVSTLHKNVYILIPFNEIPCAIAQDYTCMFLFKIILDNLLDDLQTTVTRTAQHLDLANASKSRDVQFLKPSNSTTVVEERTVSPGGVSKRITNNNFQSGYATVRRNLLKLFILNFIKRFMQDNFRNEYLFASILCIKEKVPIILHKNFTTAASLDEYIPLSKNAYLTSSVTDNEMVSSNS